jgi:hypothetical protein
VGRPAVGVAADQPAPFIVALDSFLLLAGIDVEVGPAEAEGAFHGRKEGEGK